MPVWLEHGRSKYAIYILKSSARSQRSLACLTISFIGLSGRGLTHGRYYCQSPNSPPAICLGETSGSGVSWAEDKAVHHKQLLLWPSLWSSRLVTIRWMRWRRRIAISRYSIVISSSERLQVRSSPHRTEVLKTRARNPGAQPRHHPDAANHSSSLRYEIDLYKRSQSFTYQCTISPCSGSDIATMRFTSLTYVTTVFLALTLTVLAQDTTTSDDDSTYTIDPISTTDDFPLPSYVAVWS